MLAAAKRDGDLAENSLLARGTAACDLTDPEDAGRDGAARGKFRTLRPLDFVDRLDDRQCSKVRAKPTRCEMRIAKADLRAISHNLSRQPSRRPNGVAQASDAPPNHAAQNDDGDGERGRSHKLAEQHGDR